MSTVLSLLPSGEGSGMREKITKFKWNLVLGKLDVNLPSPLAPLPQAGEGIKNYVNNSLPSPLGRRDGDEGKNQ